MIDFLGEFVSTFGEWHYFVGGFCFGWIARSLWEPARERLAP